MVRRLNKETFRKDDLAKLKADKLVSEVNFNVYESLYKFDTKQTKRHIYKLSRVKKGKKWTQEIYDVSKARIIQCLLDMMRLNKFERITFTNYITETQLKAQEMIQPSIEIFLLSQNHGTKHKKTH